MMKLLHAIHIHVFLNLLTFYYHKDTEDTIPLRKDFFAL